MLWWSCRKRYGQNFWHRLYCCLLLNLIYPARGQSTRLECTDASMSGLGRAFGIFPEMVARALARYTDHQGVYTNLSLPWGIGLQQRYVCPMRKIRLPIERIRWTKSRVPWRCKHITLGEADAACWAAEDRLRRPPLWRAFCAWPGLGSLPCACKG